MAFLDHDLACLFTFLGVSLDSRLYRGGESWAVPPAHCLSLVELSLFARYLLLTTAVSCSRIDFLLIIESSFRLQDLQTHRDDKEKSGAFPRRVVKFSSISGVVVVLKKLPCPDNLKLIPQIRQQLSLDKFSTSFRVFFDELVGIFLFFLHGELTGV